MWDGLLADCVFCSIVRGEAPASRVYEDKWTLAFLSISPQNEGHTLVVPKKHYENIYEIPKEEIGRLFRCVKRVALGVKKAEKADGISIIQNNGEAAGQVVFHLHVHVIPRHEKRKVYHDENLLERMNEIAKKIATYV